MNKVVRDFKSQLQDAQQEQYRVAILHAVDFLKTIVGWGVGFAKGDPSGLADAVSVVSTFHDQS